MKTSWFSAVIRGVSALISGEETSSHMNLSDLSCRMCLVFEVVVFCAATRIKAFFLIVALFEVVVFLSNNPHQGILSDRCIRVRSS